MTAPLTNDLLDARRLALELVEQLEWVQAAARERGELDGLAVLRAVTWDLRTAAESLARLIAATGRENERNRDG